MIVFSHVSPLMLLIIFIRESLLNYINILLCVAVLIYIIFLLITNLSLLKLKEWANFNLIFYGIYFFSAVIPIFYWFSPWFRADQTNRKLATTFWDFSARQVLSGTSSPPSHPPSIFHTLLLLFCCLLLPLISLLLFPCARYPVWDTHFMNAISVTHYHFSIYSCTSGEWIRCHYLIRFFKD